MKLTNKSTGKLLCCLICVIMAVTGACTTSFATAESNSSAGNDQQDVQQDNEGAVEPENPDAEKPAEDNGGISLQSEVSGVNVNLVGEMEGVVIAELSWKAVNGADSYTVYVNDKIKESGIDGTECNAYIEEPKPEEYKIAVAAIKNKETGGTEEIAHKEFKFNLGDFVALNTKIKLDTMLKTSGTKQKQSKKRKYPIVNDSATTVAVNPDVNITWDGAANANSYKVVKYVTDGDGEVNKDYEPVESVTEKVNAEGNNSFSYREYVEEPVFMSKNYGYYGIKVLTDASSNINGVNVTGHLYSDFGKYTSLNKTTYDYFCMNKFLDEQIADNNRTYISDSATGRNYNGDRAPTVRTIKFYAKTNKRAKYYVKGKGNAGKGWLSKGTAGWTQGGSGSKFEFYTGDRHGYVMRKNLTCYKIDYSPYVDWTAHKKENFVNKNSRFKTGGKYVIWISRYTQTINIFEKKDGKWKLVRLAECTTGQFRNYTSGGDKKIGKRIAHRVRTGRHYYYLNCFSGLNSMHGPTYNNKTGNLKSRPSTHLGKNGMSSGTLGCVRTWNTDAQWIWNKCVKGTKVVVY